MICNHTLTSEILSFKKIDDSLGVCLLEAVDLGVFIY